MDRLIREDAFDTHPPDTGCEVAPRCIYCPLPVCKYEMPNGVRSHLSELRKEAVQKRRAMGDKVEDIARDLGISERQVSRLTKGETS